MTITRAALATIAALPAAAGVLPSGSTARDSPTEPPELRTILDGCRADGTPWKQCFLDGQSANQLTNDELSCAETCVLAGGDADYRFPHLAQHYTAQAPAADSAWFFLRPRSPLDAHTA